MDQNKSEQPDLRDEAISDFRVSRRTVVVGGAGLASLAILPMLSRSSGDAAAFDASDHAISSEQYDATQGYQTMPLVRIDAFEGRSESEVKTLLDAAHRAIVKARMTKSAALEGAPFGVRVNAVAPGPTDTGMLTRFTGSAENKAALLSGVPLGRIGQPEDIANAIVFVSSDAASFLTGQIITADGGKTAG